MSWKDYLKAVLWGLGSVIIVEFLLGFILMILTGLKMFSYSSVLDFTKSWFNELLALIIVSFTSAWRASIYSRK